MKKKSELKDFLGFTLFALSITWLVSFSVSRFPEKIEVGMVLKQDIRADRPITITDEEETNKDREKALGNVLPVFDFDEQLPEGAPLRLRPIFLKPMVAEMTLLHPYKDKGIVLHRIHPPEGLSEEEEIILRDISQITTVEAAKRKVWPSLQKWITPNTVYDLKETESRKEMAARAVKEETVTYEPGDSILKAGTKLERADTLLLDRIKKARGLENRPIRFLGTFLFVFLALGATLYSSKKFIKKFLPSRKDYLLMGLVIVLTLFILRGSLILAGVLHEAFFYDIPLTALYNAIPVAGGVMLVRLFLNAEASLVLAIILGLLSGLTIGSDVNYTTYCLISGIAASSAIARASHRTAIIKAGCFTGLINAATILGILLIRVAVVEGTFHWISIFSHLSFAFLGGIFASIFVFLATPIFEILLGYATDIKLMELANLNHPLLRELIVRAPGTYHHSHIVGVLAEAAAEAIGANPLLARVSAYYHDIGKMKKPNYFTENAPPGKSRHEGLSPHMSALIVASHVKEGMALAKAHKLPQKIINMIPEHHGTKRIGIFYERALEKTDPGIQQIEEKDFRYAGPRPQSQEAGILMLADSVEASVRALKEKTPTKIKKTVEEMIDKTFAEAELDECDLTLKDLHEIGKAFIRILSALHHQRIDYGETKLDQTAQGKANPSKAEEARPAIVHRLKFPSG